MTLPLAPSICKHGRNWDETCDRCEFERYPTEVTTAQLSQYSVAMAEQIIADFGIVSPNSEKFEHEVAKLQHRMHNVAKAYFVAHQEPNL